MNLSGEVIRDFVNFFKIDIEDILIICDDLDTKDYVLGKFAKEEMNLINPIIEKIPNIIEDYLKLPFDNVMNKYN